MRYVFAIKIVERTVLVHIYLGHYPNGKFLFIKVILLMSQ